MTPGRLIALLTALAPGRSWPEDLQALMSAVESCADEHPGDPVWTGLLLHAHQLATADVPLPQGLRREHLVRADGISATWTASDPEGRAWIARAPRPTAPAVAHRILERDRRALGDLVTGLQERDGALLAPADGVPLAESAALPADVPRGLADLVRALTGWEAAGLAPAEPHPAELRLVDGSVRLVVLTPGSEGTGPAIRAVARHLVAGGALGRFLDGLRDLPPGSASGVADGLARVFAEDLGERAVSLRRRSLLAGHGARRAGLLRAVTALEASVPPPEGRGAVGFDLDGRPTVVVGADRIVRWGPTDADGEIVWDASGFRAAVARRLLRALASAPVGVSVQRETGGSPAYTEAIGRWVSAGLRLRTVRLLLEKT